MQPAHPDHLTGTVLEGRYALGPRIARGGTASVYRAVDTRLQRTVAVKLLHPHLAEDPAAAERFAREARAAAGLSHPHVVSVLDQGHAPDGTPYLVMEHVQGITLRDLLRRRGALSPREALELMDPVLDGLAAAHRAGLVHRDVKPENVLIADTGRVTVADFGLTRAVGQHTATGSVLGTVGYASPELVTGGPVDTRADVYSAGIVLFELLTGHRPFTGSALAVARAHAEGRVPDLRSLDPGAPEGPARLVARATARDPGLRPADAARMLAELRSVRAGLRPPEPDRLPGRSTAPTETLRPGTGPTRPMGSGPGRTGAAAAPARSSGSSDPWRPVVELRPANPVRTAVVVALAGLGVAAAAFLGWLLGSGPGGSAIPTEVRGAGPEISRQHAAWNEDGAAPAAP